MQSSGKGVAIVSIANEALRAVICARLMGDFRVSASAIDVCCRDGEVCLVGCADSVEQKTLAVTLASGVIGVRTLKDEIVVRGQVANLSS
jgi:osmotically-inducible protein OsmY